MLPPKPRRRSNSMTLTGVFRPLCLYALASLLRRCNGFRCGQISPTGVWATGVMSSVPSLVALLGFVPVAVVSVCAVCHDLPG